MGIMNQVQCTDLLQHDLIVLHRHSEIKPSFDGMLRPFLSITKTIEA
jgi:hypothetical protein